MIPYNRSLFSTYYDKSFIAVGNSSGIGKCWGCSVDLRVQSSSKNMVRKELITDQGRHDHVPKEGFKFRGGSIFVSHQLQSTDFLMLSMCSSCLLNTCLDQALSWVSSHLVSMQFLSISILILQMRKLRLRNASWLSERWPV